MVENETEFNNNPNRDDERISRLSGGTSPSSGDFDDLVKEYEQRYRPEPKQKIKAKPRAYSTLQVSDDDKLWAAFAHGSVWVTFLMAVPTSGISIPFVVFVPLILYFLFRNRSDYVAFHALQAFVLQLICTVGALMLVVVGGLLWAFVLAITVLLSAVLIGIPLFIVVILIGIIASVVLSTLPLVGLVLATIATVRVYTGNDYRYPYIANWVDRQMAGGFLNA